MFRIPTLSPGWLIVAIIVVASTSGCQKNRTHAQMAAPTIENFLLHVQTDSVLVNFDVVDPLERNWEALIYFSDDLGLTWFPVTASSPEEGTIELTPPFQSIATSWSFRGDLNTLPQADVLLEVRIFDLNGSLEAHHRSDPFAIGDTSPPVVQSIVVPSGPVGGPIAVSGSVFDADGDHVTVHLEWSLDGNEPWSLASLEGEDQVVILADKGAETVEFVWLSHIDSPAVVSPFTRVRIVASDASGSHQQVSDYLPLNTIPPRIDSMTIGEIVDNLNGSEAATTDAGDSIPFTLSMPSVDSRIQVQWSAGPGGASVDPATLEVSADKWIADRPPGDDISDLFTVIGSTADWNIRQEDSLPLGLLQLTATVDDLRGNPALPLQYQVNVTAGSAQARPFDWHDRWYLDFQRDNYEIGLQIDAQSQSLTPFASAGSDGIADHHQDLLTVGLQSNQATSASNAAGVNPRVQQWVEEAILDRVRSHYGVGMLAGGEHLQPNISFDRFSTSSTSAVGIGGDDSDAYSYALGRASFDYRNQTANNETAPTRGVFTSNMIQFYWNSWTFRNRFQAILPGLGIPVGEDLLDPIVLSDGFIRLDPGNTVAENDRYDGVWDAIDAWSRVVSIVAAHEIGHAVGLCANGLPPTGLFGGESDLDLAGPFTTAFHIDTPGLNVMSSALGLTSALVEGESGYQFNSLNKAYIAEWTTLEP